MLNSIKLPDSPETPPSSGVTKSGGSKITISDIRVVKRGKPFQAFSPAGSPSEVLPVRVSVKGVRVVEYVRVDPNSNMFVHDKDVRLPFEGETDFHIAFEPPDKAKVDPGPGKWVASPAPQ